MTPEQRIKELESVLRNLLEEIECLSDIQVSRDLDKYKAEVSWEYALEQAYLTLKGKS